MTQTHAALKLGTAWLLRLDVTACLCARLGRVEEVQWLDRQRGSAEGDLGVGRGTAPRVGTAYNSFAMRGASSS